MTGRIAVVDNNNRFIRWEERRAIHEQRLVHRSVHVMVFDSQQRLVIQRRHPDKQTYPNHWDNSVAGHVEESDYFAGVDERLDEVYREVAGRELQEELGVSAELTELAHFAPMADVHYEQQRLFSARHNGPYTMQEEEVAEIRRVGPAEYDALLASEQPVTRALAFFVRWSREQGLW